MEWRTADGTPPDIAAWELPDGRLLTCVITVGEPGKPPLERLMLILLAGERSIEVSLPDGEWDLVMDSARGWVGDNTPPTTLASSLLVEPPTMLVLVQPLQTHPVTTP